MTHEQTGSSLARTAEPLSPWPRGWLFTPADDVRKLEHAERCGAEAVIADLEDSVAPERKQAARENALGFLAAAAGTSSPLRIVRINDPRCEQGRLDLERLRAAVSVTVMVPKACAATVQHVRTARLRTIALVEQLEDSPRLSKLRLARGSSRSQSGP